MRAILNRNRRIAAETAWVFAGQGASAIAALVGLRVITEMVPPVTYGAVALALGVIALAHGLAVGPLMQAALRFYPDLAREGRESELRRASLLALRTPALITLVVLSALGAGWSFWRPQDAWLAALSIALFAAEAARSVEITFLNASRRQRTLAILVTVDAWLRPITAVALVWVFGANGAAVVGGYLAGCLVALGCFRLVAKAPDRDHAQTATPFLRLADISHRLRGYAFPLTALPLIGWVAGQADRYLVGGFAGVAAAGVYAALYGLASKPFLILSASFDLAFRQPYYTHASASDHMAERRALLLWLAAVTGVSLAFCLLFLLFHAEIAALLLASEYRTHSALMVWIAAGYVFLCMAQVFERACYAHHDTRGVLWVEATGAALSVAVAAPLVYTFGIVGAAWAVPVYFGAQLLIAAARARRARRRAARSRAAAAVPFAAPTAR